MKQLLIIRHAKSDQSFFGSDFERPLNERGKSDAPVMAKRLLDKKIEVDAFVSSPAKRAKKTAEIFAKEYGVEEEAIIFISALYHAPKEVLYDVVEHLSDEHDHVAIFTHNPGISYFANTLVPGVAIDNMPTCGIFAIRIDTDSWKDFKKSTKKFLFFDYPKAY